MEEKKFAEGFCFYKLFWVFLFGCLFGNYYEEILTLVVHYHNHHEFIWQLKRGVMYGPISPIYGFGALLMVLLLARKKRSDWKTFFLGAIIGGTFEYLCSFFQEMIFGTVSWDYTNEFLNIHGRTTIPFAFVWGFLAVVMIKIFYPSISSIIEELPIKFGTILTKTLILLISIDLFISWGALFRQVFRHNGYQPVTVMGVIFDKYYPDEVIRKKQEYMTTFEARK